MAMIDMIRHSDGRILYPCGTQAYPPTNPKAGSPTGGNTVIWNARTRKTTLIVPRQNPVNVDSWTPQSSSRYTGPKAPATYQKPQPIRVATEAATTRTNRVINPCQTASKLKTVCWK